MFSLSQKADSYIDSLVFRISEQNQAIIPLVSVFQY